MKKIFSLLTISMLICSISTAQNAGDVLRYSQDDIMGTARFVGSAGAFGAIGADFSSLSYNPAGIGLYRTSEFSVSPALFFANSKSTYSGNTSEDFKTSFGFGNVGAVFTSTPKESSSWKRVQFGMGLNQISNYDRRSYIKGDNLANSMINEFQFYAQGIDPDDLNDFDTRLAYMTFLLDQYDPNTGDYTIAVPNGGVQQSKSIFSNGYKNEMVFTLGGNYADKLYVGGTIGVPFLYYDENSTYSEYDVADSIANFNSFKLHDQFTTNGTGINFKLGLIYRVSDWVRFGLAYHTPTYWSLNDKYSRSIDSDLASGKYSSESPEGNFNYKMETPMKAIGSLAIIINKAGFISADYEFVDYSTGRLRSEDTRVNFADKNEVISNAYTYASNIRIGGEWHPLNYKVKAGYALYGSPYKNRGGEFNGARDFLTFGLGLTEDRISLDAAFIRQLHQDEYYLYDPGLVTATNQLNTLSSFIFTFGYKF